ncbi:MAG: hypothetical protein WAM01_13895 [Candidatus Acidiferrales bacterium]
MGGISGEIRANTQSEAWTKFEDEVRSQVEDKFGLFLEAPLTREAAYRGMWKDEKSGAWVLDYRFSK